MTSQQLITKAHRLAADDAPEFLVMPSDDAKKPLLDEKTAAWLTKKVAADYLKRG